MKNVYRQISFVGISLISLILFTTTVVAVGKPQGVGAQGIGQGQIGRNTNVPNIPVSPGANGKLRSCQARESAIKTRMNHLTQLVTAMENKFDAIATRVENFYSSKVVASGKTVSNYDALVADIQTKKTAVQTTLTKAQTDANSFSCASGTPKAQMTQFKDDMQTVKKALKDYRTAIKNLIVAVHSVTGTEERVSPKPTK